MLVVMSENLRLVFVGTFLLSLIFSVSSGLLTDDDDDIFLQEDDYPRMKRFFGGGHHGGWSGGHRGGGYSGGHHGGGYSGGHHGGYSGGHHGGYPGGHGGGYHGWHRPSPTPINGGWSEWVAYGPCSLTCHGKGVQQARRVCNNPPPQHGGRPCPGVSQRVYVCNRFVPCGVDGGWSAWQSSGVCQKSDAVTTPVSCGAGVKKYTRACTNPTPSGGGAACSGADTKIEPCDGGPCKDCTVIVPPNQVLFNGEESMGQQGEVKHGHSVSVACRKGYEQTSGEGGTTYTCSNGQLTGNHIVCQDVNECTGGEAVCDLTSSTCVNTDGGYRCQCKPGFQANAQGECKNVPIHGGWGEWSPSGGCSASCGGGMMRYERKCDSPSPQHGGNPCSGADFKLEECNTNCCPVDGGWSDYVDGACSKTCGVGVMKRTRTCTQPAAECGGRDCVGPSEVETQCNLRECDGCPIPSASAGVNFVLSPGTTSIPHGGTLQYSCGEGFSSLSGGGFASLTCNSGQWSGTASCKDVDECKEGFSSCNPDTSTCENTEGGYECVCKAGYKLAENGVDCNDIDECVEGEAGCEQGCRNDFGSYSCYCQAGYELEGSSKCTHVSNECADLPPLQNGEMQCTVEDYGKKCLLKCKNGYAMPGIGVQTYQLCTSGVWDYEKHGKELPECEEVGGLDLFSDLSFDSQGDCDPSADYSVDASQLGSSSASATCSGSLKRATGTLDITITFKIPIPEGCDSSCLERLKRKMADKQKAVNKRAASGKAKVKLTNLQTSKKTTLSLKGEGIPSEPTAGCGQGQTLTEVDSEKKCVPCSRGTYYSLQTSDCRACPIGMYGNNPGSIGVSSCTACSKGKSTAREGSKSKGACQVMCEAGHYSESGFAPCQPCPIGTYSPHPGSKICYQCDFELVTKNKGSTSSLDCRCEEENKYWQKCAKTCHCKNGGMCQINGKCICPRGWIGYDCSKEDPVAECQDQYYVRMFWQKMMTTTLDTYILSSDSGGDIDIIEANYAKGEVVDSQSDLLGPLSYTKLTLDPNAKGIYQIGLYPSDKMQILAFTDQPANGAGAFSPLPIQELRKGESEVYRTVVPGPRWKGFDSIIAFAGTQDGTVVEVTPSRTAFSYYTGATQTIAKGTTKRFYIDQYRLIKIQSQFDLTGSKVQANYPIALFSGHECGRISKVNKKSCDYTIEQLPSVDNWGSCYIAASFQGGSGTSVIKIVSHDAVANVEIHCTLANGNPSTSRSVSTKDYVFKYAMRPNEYCYFHSQAAPIMVTQFHSQNIGKSTYTGPSMVVLPDVSLKANNIPFFIPSDSRTQFITFTVREEHYNPIDIQLDSDSLGVLNYSAVQMNTLCGNFQVISSEVSKGYHRITHSNMDAGIQMVVYGVTGDGAYAYSPGMNQGLSCANQT